MKHWERAQDFVTIVIRVVVRWGLRLRIPELQSRLNPELAARRLKNYLSTMVLEAQTLARACGKSHVLNLEPQDLVALTVEAAAMAHVPLAGTDWIPGKY